MYKHKIILNYINILNVYGPRIIKKLYRAVRNSMLQVGPYLLPFFNEGNFHLYLYHFYDSMFRRPLNIFLMKEKDKL